jgi:hypothetical protein
VYSIVAGKNAHGIQFMLKTLAVAAAASRPSQSTIGHSPTQTDSPLGPNNKHGEQLSDDRNPCGLNPPPARASMLRLS